MNNLPRLRRRRPRWQRAGIGTAQFIGFKAVQLVAGLALGFAAIAVADTIADPAWQAAAQYGVILGVAGIVVVAIWARKRTVDSKQSGRRRNPSTDSQTHNLSNRGLSRRFRRG